MNMNFISLFYRSPPSRRYLSICLTEAPPGSGRATNVGDDLVRRLEQVTTEPDCPPSAWMLLMELSAHMRVRPEFAERAFDSLRLGDPDDRIPTYVTKIIANSSARLSAAKREELKRKLADKIKGNR